MQYIASQIVKKKYLGNCNEKTIHLSHIKKLLTNSYNFLPAYIFALYLYSTNEIFFVSE